MGLKVSDVSSLETGRQIFNSYFEQIIDTSDEWIESRTGIKSRYFTDELPSDMAVRLGKQLRFDRDRVKMILVSSFTNDLILPSIAGRVHARLDIPDGCFCMDVNSACAGFLASMILAEKFLNENEQAILIAAEQTSTYIDPKDRGASILFGDGCAGMVVEKNSKLWYSDENTYDDEGCLLMSKGEMMYMQGQKVFRFACSRVPESIERVLDKAGMTIDDIDYLVSHQANDRILDQIVKRVKIDDSRVLKNVSSHGNTSAASIPILMDECKNAFKPGDRLLLTAFGAGLAINSILMEW